MNGQMDGLIDRETDRQIDQSCSSKFGTTQNTDSSQCITGHTGNNFKLIFLQAEMVQG